jgi:hypothetical protein
MEQNKVRGMHLVDQHGNGEVHSVDHLLLAIPVEKVTGLVRDELYACAPALGELRHVRTRPMTAFNVYFKGRIPRMPSDHVNLLESRYGISFIDVSQTWETENRTVLNLIASDVTDLESLSPRLVVSALMEDLRRYLPFTLDDVERITLQTHRDQPLFMNDVGGWAFRSTARTQVKNLYVAGDFCQTPIDLVSMEGAVTSALTAAEAIRGDLAIGSPIKILVPPVYNRLLFVLGRLALLPAAAIAKAWTFLTGSDFDPVATNVPPFDLMSLPEWPIREIDESLPTNTHGQITGDLS